MKSAAIILYGLAHTAWAVNPNGLNVNSNGLNVLVPPKGWNSWDCFQGDLNETGVSLSGLTHTVLCGRAEFGPAGVCPAYLYLC